MINCVLIGLFPCLRLEYLPPQIGELVDLGVLSLRENLLANIPSEIGTCRELHVLDVSGNRLQHLPFTLTNLNLKALWLAENQVYTYENYFFFNLLSVACT